MSEQEPVLVVGALGMLGGKVVDRAARPGQTGTCPGAPEHRRAAAGGPGRRDRPRRHARPRLAGARDGRRRRGDHHGRRVHPPRKNATEIDTVGQANLAVAASRTGVRRFVLTSILTCDQTPQVPHFWHKKLAEDKLEELGVPFVALRPGAFLDQAVQWTGDPFATGRLMWIGKTDVPLTFVLTTDLAGYLADAVDAPGVEGQRIDIGWDRPVSMQDVAGLGVAAGE